MNITIPASLRPAYIELTCSPSQGESLPEIKDFNRSNLAALERAASREISDLEDSLKGSAEPGSEEWEHEEDKDFFLPLRDSLSGNKRLRAWIEDARNATDPIHSQVQS